MTKTIISVVLLVSLLGFTGSDVSAESDSSRGGGIREKMQEARNEREEKRSDLRETIREKFAEIKKKFGFGKAMIVNAQVTAISGSVITVKNGDATYTVTVSEKTRYRRRFWGASTLGEIAVGHLINVAGTWTNEEHTAISAAHIRNLSVRKRAGVFFGIVKSFTDGGWVMGSSGVKRPDQTVTVSTGTKYVNRRGDTISRSDIKFGHRVRVRGVWDSQGNTITEVTEVKDFSLPEQTGKTGETEASVTVTPSVTPTAGPTIAPSATPSPTATPTPTTGAPVI